MAKGHPKWKQEPKPKEVRIQASPQSVDSLSPAWQFHRRDRDHVEWGWDKVSDAEMRALIHDTLCNLESMTWHEILAVAGGRARGNNHHFIPVAECCKAAQQRLAELHLDDIDEVFSLRVTGTLRLFGIKDGRVLRFIWHDPEHGVYPVAR